MELQRFLAVVTIIVVASAPLAARAQLSTSYYDTSCSNLESTVNSAFQSAVDLDKRIGASLLRMHFHDCFVNGCDGSVLLADTPTFTGEQSSIVNADLRGFDVVASIKSAVESVCPNTVSCADLLALIARDAVISYGGPFWAVEYGRRDSTTACLSCVINDVPAPTFDAAQLTASFANFGLSQTDLVALSGSHTVGKSHCAEFASRLYNYSGVVGESDPTINPTYLAILEGECPQGASTDVVVDLDPTSNFVFDNNYYTNLLDDAGLLTSDETLWTEAGPTIAIVDSYAASQSSFFSQYAISMVKLGEIGPLTGSEGEIRTVCSQVNS